MFGKDVQLPLWFDLLIGVGMLLFAMMIFLAMARLFPPESISVFFWAMPIGFLLMGSSLFTWSLKAKNWKAGVFGLFLMAGEVVVLLFLGRANDSLAFTLLGAIALLYVAERILWKIDAAI